MYISRRNFINRETQIYLYIQTKIYIYNLIDRYTCINTDSYTHTHTHTNKYTYIHTYIYIYIYI